MKEKVVCFTGHRPEKLPCHDRSSVQTMVLKSFLYKEIYDCINEGFTVFVTGLSLGVDIWASTIVMEFMSKNPDIKLITAIPYKNFGAGRKGIDYWEYKNTLAKSSEVISIAPKFVNGCMEKRNHLMVDMSDRVIAILLENKSGTAQTVRYARKKGVETHIIDLKGAEDAYREHTPFLI